ncbi:MAG: peptidoglycan-binding protein [Qingshengfaniella sp.]
MPFYSNRRILPVIFSIWALAIANPVRANDDLNRLLGIGAAILLNQAAKSQNSGGNQSSGQGAARGGGAGGNPAQAAAMDLQRDLNTLGFDAGPVDGQPGARTRAAIEAYQVSRGFAATGTLSPVQRIALDIDAAVAAAGGAETAELRRLEILEAQSYLQQLGYTPGTPDGAWGPRSQGALEAFRRETGTALSGGGLNTADRLALYDRVHGTAPVGRPDMLRVAASQPVVPAAPATVSVAPSFDCALAGTSVERAICASPRLAALDLALAAAWAEAVARAGGNQALLPAQTAWLAARNACGADSACLENSMAGRILALGGAVPAGTVAVAQAGGQTVSVSSGPVLSAPAPEAASARVHVIGNRFVQAPVGFDRQLMLRQVRLKPEILEPDGTVAAIVHTDRARTQGISSNTVAAELRQLNQLDYADLIARTRAQVLQEAQVLAPIAPDNPLPVAFYLGSSATEFEEGKGLHLVQRNGQTAVGMARDYPQARLSVPLDTAAFGTLPLDRAAAGALLDRQRAERDQGRTLTLVVWGRITRFGADDTVADFAQPGGAFNRETPVTFVFDAATLHFRAAQDGAFASQAAAEAEALHVFRPVAAGTAPQGSRDALVLARELGLPVEGEAVTVSYTAQDRRASGWAAFNAYTLVALDPDYAREGDRFADLAALVLSEADQRSYFGSTNLIANNGFFQDNGFGVAARAFPDAFARQDAKRAFFETYYPRIQAVAPIWPLPLRYTLDVRLGDYDFDTQSFPIYWGGLATAGTPIVNLPLGVANARAAGIRSVDQFSIPEERLSLPPDQARALNDRLAPDRRVTFAWWADFTGFEGGAEIGERLGMGAYESGLPFGRAVLKRAGLFADPDLTLQVRDYDVAALTVPIPDPVVEATPEAPVVSDDVAALNALEPSGPAAILAVTAQAMGGTPADYEALARTQPAVQGANEFDEPAILAATVEEIRAAQAGPYWARGTARLDRYDLETGTFSFQGANRLYFSVQGQGLRINPALTGPEVFDTLAVPQDVARRAVEYFEQTGRRNVTFMMRVTPAGLGPNSNGTQNLALLLRPEEVVFFLPEDRILGETVILGRRDFAQANAAARARAERRYEVADFAGLDAQPQRVDPHVLDLVWLAETGATPSAEQLAGMMASAWRHEGAAGEGIGPRFFTAGAAFPEPVERMQLSDSFLSFVQAKAAALGEMFEVRLEPPRTQDRACGWGSDQNVYLGNTPIGELVPQFRDDQQAKVEKIRAAGEEVAVTLDRRYGLFMRRQSARYDNCESWLSAVEISGAVQESAADGTQPVVLAFRKTGFASVAAQNYLMPLMVLRGAGEGAWRLTADGTRGEEIVPVALAAPDQSPASDPAQSSGQSSMPGQSSAAVPAPVSDTPPSDRMAVAPAPGAPARGDWPGPDAIEVAVSETDLLEIRTGMSIEAAAEILLARDGLGAVYETATSPAAGRDPLAYRRVFFYRDGQEAITLGSYAPEGPVLAVMRRMSLTSGVLPYDQIDAALTEKYGRPVFDMGNNGFRGYLGSFGDGRCHILPVEPLNMRGLTRLPGGSGWAPVRSGGLDIWAVNLPAYEAQMLAVTQGCGTVLVYMAERPEEWMKSGFSTTLIDLDGVRQTVAELAASAADSNPALAIDF